VNKDKVELQHCVLGYCFRFYIKVSFLNINRHPLGSLVEETILY
jgi:hypothetical protein